MWTSRHEAIGRRISDRRIAWAYDATEEDAEAIAVVSQERAGSDRLLLQIAEEYALGVGARQALVRQGDEVLCVTLDDDRWTANPSRSASGLPKRTSGYAVTSLVLGILGVTVMPLLGGILALYFAGKAEDEIEESDVYVAGEGYATAGRVLGFIGLILGLISLVLIIAVVIWASQDA